MRKLLILLTLSIAFAITANAQTNFVGKYTFYEDGGKTAGGTGIGIGHELEIKSDGTVILNAAGFQTARELIGTIKTVGSKVMIYFTLYDANGVNSGTDYKAEDLLLTLEYKAVKGKINLWSTFGKYEPVVVTAKKAGGIYFKKSKN